MRKSWHEYTAIKDQYPEEVVLFVEGDYTVALCNDAEILAESCALILTGRDFPEVGRVELCGFPTNDRHQYVSRLFSDGWDVHIHEGEA